jgi:hypothetical protein
MRKLLTPMMRARRVSDDELAAASLLSLSLSLSVACPLFPLFLSPLSSFPLVSLSLSLALSLSIHFPSLSGIFSISLHKNAALYHTFVNSDNVLGTWSSSVDYIAECLFKAFR